MRRNNLIPTLVSLSPALVAFASAGSSCGPDVMHFPLNYKYGDGKKVSTDLQVPGSSEKMEVCYDSGSEIFWAFTDNTTLNWGFHQPPGTCSQPVGSPNYPIELAGVEPVDMKKPSSFSLFYGGGARLIGGTRTLTPESMSFSSDAGVVSTLSNVTFGIPDMEFYAYDVDECRPKHDIAQFGYIDRAILGVAKYSHQPGKNGYVSSEPHLRHNLLKEGIISHNVQSIWFDEAPANYKDSYTGGGLLGGIDMSKFSGPLVKVQTAKAGNDDLPSNYLVAPPTVGFEGKRISSAGFHEKSCLLDSGTTNDAIPVSAEGEAAWLKAAGLVKTKGGDIAYPGPCESVPLDKAMEYTFLPAAAGSSNSTSLFFSNGTNTSGGKKEITIRVPFRNYVHADDGKTTDKQGNEACKLSLYTAEDYGDCRFGAPFHTAAFFAADDDRDEVALAQGGVSKAGSGYSKGKIATAIP